jgi:hypothetical protein
MGANRGHDGRFPLFVVLLAAPASAVLVEPSAESSRLRAIASGRLAQPALDLGGVRIGDSNQVGKLSE